jgi:hypothetical protein
MIALLLSSSLFAGWACSPPPSVAGGTGSAGATAIAGGTQGQGLVIENPVGNRRTFFDFGDVAFGREIKHVFQIRNADLDPVTIHDILPSCGCTVARITYEDAGGKEVMGSIAPGERVITLPPGVLAHLTLSVDTTHVETMNRDKLTQVRVRSDSKNTPYLTLEMHLVVRRSFRSVPDRIELSESPRSAGKSGRADITVEEAKSQAQIRGIASIEGPFDATVDPTTVSGVEVWILVATPKPDLPLGPARGRVTLATTRDDGTGEGPPFSVSLSAQITEDVVLHPAVLTLKRPKPDEALSARTELEALIPGQRVKVLGTKVEGLGAEALHVELAPTDPDVHGRASLWEIRLRAAPDTQVPTFAGHLTIELDHPRVPKLEVRYSGTSR